MLRAPELDAGLPEGVSPEQSRGAEPPPSPCAHAAGDAAQGTVGLLHCECILPGCVELLVNKHPQVLLLRAALNPFSTRPVFVHGIAPAHVKDLVELHEVCMSLPLKPVKVPLVGIPSFQHVDHTTQLGITSKLPEGALNPTVHVAIDVKHHWSEY